MKLLLQNYEGPNRKINNPITQLSVNNSTINESKY